MKKKQIAKCFKVIALSGILLLSVGCAQDTNEESESVQNIRAVLKKEFNGPSKELGDVIDHGKNKTKFERFGKYLEKNFKPYLSEGYYENYVISTVSAFRFLRAAHPEYKLKTEDIEIKESETTEGSYSFSVDVSYTKKGSNDSETIEARGIMNTNEEGEITRIEYINFVDLLTTFD